MTDVTDDLRMLEKQGEDYIWRTAEAARKEIEQLRSALEFARDAHTILREALAAYADAYMDQPVTEDERQRVASKHQRKPRMPTTRS